MMHYCNLYTVRMLEVSFMKCIVLLRDVVQVCICIIKRSPLMMIGQFIIRSMVPSIVRNQKDIKIPGT